MVTHHILQRLGIYCSYLVSQNWRDPIGPSLYFLPLLDISMTHLTDVGRKNDLVHLTFSETNESLSECSRTSSLGHCIVLACGPKYAAFGLVYFFVVWLIFSHFCNEWTSCLCKVQDHSKLQWCRDLLRLNLLCAISECFLARHDSSIASWPIVLRVIVL